MTLRALAAAATQEHDKVDHSEFVDCEACTALRDFWAAMTPERALAMQDCCDLLREHGRHRTTCTAQQCLCGIEAALARLEGMG